MTLVNENFTELGDGFLVINHLYVLRMKYKTRTLDGFIRVLLGYSLSLFFFSPFIFDFFNDKLHPWSLLNFKHPTHLQLFGFSSNYYALCFFCNTFISFLLSL